MANAHDLLMAQRAAMMGGKPTALDYIGAKEAHDGQPSPLVAIFDGEYNTLTGHDPNATTWVNLVNGVAAPLVGSPTIMPKCLSCKAITDGATIGVFDVSDYYTIEVCMARFGGSYGGVHPTSVRDRKCIMFDGGYVGNAVGAPKVTFADYTKPHTVAMTFDEDAGIGYGDGVASGLTYNDYWSIGGGVLNYSPLNPSRGGIADYYCIRLYNRAITAEEVAHNYAIDKARFDLT